MTRSLALAPATAGMLGLGGAGLAEAAGPVTVQLSPQNSSGESGTATLTESGTKTKVVVAINGAPAGVAQPLHVHKGTCAQLDHKPAFGLTTLTDGKSGTTIDVSLNALQTDGYAINGHKSAQDANTYVFCGAIPGSQQTKRGEQMAQRAKTKDSGTTAGKPPRGSQVPPREVEKRQSTPGPPAADTRKTAEVRRSEPSEDFAQRDIETADEPVEQHDRRRHDSGGRDVESSQPA